MNQLTGQIVRMIGLLIESLGLLILVFRTGTEQAGVPLPGSFSPPLVWAVVGAGFVIWLVGTVMIYWARSGRAQSKAKLGDDGELRL